MGGNKSNEAYETVCGTSLTVPEDPGALTLKAGTTGVDSNNQKIAHT